MSEPTPLEAIFFAALAKAPTERAAYLNQSCNGDEVLRHRVERMLAAQGEAASFLESPPAALVHESSPTSERPGTQIGPYKLLQQIGEGGMGVVYMAEQLEPVKRRVALKIIKPGMDSRQVIVRFEVERQALSLMDHPNIARVLDAGTTANGRPYFVMELVRGQPITQYCDEHHLTPRQRLEMLLPVCHAIQHAHHKGIIHRDIKPTNILVAEYDNQPVPKVIDFGVAKAISQSLTEKTMSTGFGQIVGTLEYMSPEQAKLNQIDIDTRSDIYSLGVLLYELLTGTTPFDQARLRTLAFDETLRIIREEEPEKPSTRLFRMRSAECGERCTQKREQTATRAPQFATRSPRLHELDWIVMKCLEKDRNRRYELASGLAREICRYLHNEPIVACPPSHWYQFRKLVLRNRTAFVAAVAALLVALVGLATLATSNYLIRQEQARTRDEQRRTDEARRLAERRAEEVRQGLERLKEANAFLDQGRWYAFERRWDDARSAFSRAIELHPQHVSAWVERGDLYTHLGLWDLAAADYGREMELRESHAALRWYQHALLCRATGDDEGYQLVCGRMRKRFAGSLDVQFVEEMLRSSVLGPDPEADLPRFIAVAEQAAALRPSSLNFVIGAAHYRTNRYEQAIARLEDALDVKPQWPISRLSYPVLALAHHRLGHQDQSRRALDESTTIRDAWQRERYQTQSNSGGSPHAADAVWPVMWWDYLEFELYYREAKLRIDGSAPPDDYRQHMLRARALSGLKLLDEAANEYDAALRLRADDSQIRLELHCNRAKNCVERGQWSAAATEWAAAVELRPDDSYLWRFAAVAHLAAGDVDAYRRTCQKMLGRFGGTEDRLVAANLLLACTIQEMAVSDTSALLRMARIAEPVWHWGAWSRGAALYRAGEYEECIRCFENAALKHRPRAWDWCFLAMAHHRLGHAAESRRVLAEARRWIEAANRQAAPDPTESQPAWGDWHEPVVHPFLLSEAEALLAQDSPRTNIDSLTPDSQIQNGR